VWWLQEFGARKPDQASAPLRYYGLYLWPPPALRWHPRRGRDRVSGIFRERRLESPSRDTVEFFQVTSRLGAMVAYRRVSLVAAGLLAFFSVLATVREDVAKADSGSSNTVVVEPAYVAPIAIGIPFSRDNADRTAIGYWFTFGWDASCGEPKSLSDVRIVERPVTNARPYKSAVVYASAEYPARTHEVGPDGTPYFPACTMEYRWGLSKVKTKRPAKKLIFFDGSIAPPRRIWPPLGTPPEK
jgi:hypothetical protein